MSFELWLTPVLYWSDYNISQVIDTYTYVDYTVSWVLQAANEAVPTSGHSGNWCGLLCLLGMISPQGTVGAATLECDIIWYHAPRSCLSYTQWNCLAYKATLTSTPSSYLHTLLISHPALLIASVWIVLWHWLTGYGWHNMQFDFEDMLLNVIVDPSTMCHFRHDHC